MKNHIKSLIIISILNACSGTKSNQMISTTDPSQSSTTTVNQPVPTTTTLTAQQPTQTIIDQSTNINSDTLISDQSQSQQPTSIQTQSTSTNTSEQKTDDNDLEEKNNDSNNIYQSSIPNNIIEGESNIKNLSPRQKTNNNLSFNNNLDKDKVKNSLYHIIKQTENSISSLVPYFDTLKNSDDKITDEDIRKLKIEADSIKYYINMLYGLCDNTNPIISQYISSTFSIISASFLSLLSYINNSPSANHDFNKKSVNNKNILSNKIVNTSFFITFSFCKSICYYFTRILNLTYIYKNFGINRDGSTMEQDVKKMNKSLEFFTYFIKYASSDIFSKGNQNQNQQTKERYDLAYISQKLCSFIYSIDFTLKNPQKSIDINYYENLLNYITKLQMGWLLQNGKPGEDSFLLNQEAEKNNLKNKGNSSPFCLIEGNNKMPQNIEELLSNLLYNVKRIDFSKTTNHKYVEGYESLKKFEDLLELKKILEWLISKGHIKESLDKANDFIKKMNLILQEVKDYKSEIFKTNFPNIESDLNLEYGDYLSILKRIEQPIAIIPKKIGDTLKSLPDINKEEFYNLPDSLICQSCNKGFSLSNNFEDYQNIYDSKEKLCLICIEELKYLPSMENSLILLDRVNSLKQKIMKIKSIRHFVSSPPHLSTWDTNTIENLERIIRLSNTIYSLKIKINKNPNKSDLQNSLNPVINKAYYIFFKLFEILNTDKIFPPTLEYKTSYINIIHFSTKLLADTVEILYMTTNYLTRLNGNPPKYFNQLMNAINFHNKGIDEVIAKIEPGIFNKENHSYFSDYYVSKSIEDYISQLNNSSLCINKCTDIFLEKSSSIPENKYKLFSDLYEVCKSHKDNKTVITNLGKYYGKETNFRKVKSSIKKNLLKQYKKLENNFNTYENLSDKILKTLDIVAKTSMGEKFSGDCSDFYLTLQAINFKRVDLKIELEDKLNNFFKVINPIKDLNKTFSKEVSTIKEYYNTNGYKCQYCQTIPSLDSTSSIDSIIKDKVCINCYEKHIKNGNGFIECSNTKCNIFILNDGNNTNTEILCTKHEEARKLKISKEKTKESSKSSMNQGKSNNNKNKKNKANNNNNKKKPKAKQKPQNTTKAKQKPQNTTKAKKKQQNNPNDNASKSKKVKKKEDNTNNTNEDKNKRKQTNKKNAQQPIKKKETGSKQGTIIMKPQKATIKNKTTDKVKKKKNNNNNNKPKINSKVKSSNKDLAREEKVDNTNTNFPNIKYPESIYSKLRRELIDNKKQLQDTGFTLKVSRNQKTVKKSGISTLSTKQLSKRSITLSNESLIKEREELLDNLYNYVIKGLPEIYSNASMQKYYHSNLRINQSSEGKYISNLIEELCRQWNLQNRRKLGLEEIETKYTDTSSNKWQKEYLKDANYLSLRFHIDKERNLSALDAGKLWEVFFNNNTENTKNLRCIKFEINDRRDNRSLKVYRILLDKFNKSKPVEDIFVKCDTKHTIFSMITLGLRKNIQNKKETFISEINTFDNINLQPFELQRIKDSYKGIEILDYTKS